MTPLAGAPEMLRENTRVLFIVDEATILQGGPSATWARLGGAAATISTS